MLMKSALAAMVGKSKPAQENRYERVWPRRAYHGLFKHALAEGQQRVGHTVAAQVKPPPDRADNETTAASLCNHGDGAGFAVTANKEVPIQQIRGFAHMPEYPVGPAPVANVSRKGFPEAAIAALNSWNSRPKLVLSAALPPLSCTPGYSQSMSNLQRQDMR